MKDVAIIATGATAGGAGATATAAAYVANPIAALLFCIGACLIGVISWELWPGERMPLEWRRVVSRVMAGTIFTILLFACLETRLDHFLLIGISGVLGMSIDPIIAAVRSEAAARIRDAFSVLGGAGRDDGSSKGGKRE